MISVEKGNVKYRSDKQRINAFIQNSETIELSKLEGLKQSFLFSGGVFRLSDAHDKDGFNEEFWVKQQVFFIEVKNSDMDTVRKIGEQYNIDTPLIVQLKKEDRIVVGFKTETLVIDKRMRDLIHIALNYVFGGNEQISPHKVYEGKEVVTLEGAASELSYKTLLTAVMLKAKDTNYAHLPREIKKFCGKTNIKFNSAYSSPMVHFYESYDEVANFKLKNGNKHLYVEKLGKFQYMVIEFNSGQHIEFIDQDRNKIVLKNIEDYKKKYIIQRNRLLDKLPERCELYNTFINGNVLTKDETMHLTTNLMKVQKGEETILNYVADKNKGAWKDMIRVLRGFECSASFCTNKNCRFIQDCKNGGTILSKLECKKGEIIVIDRQERKALSVAEKELEEKFLDFARGEKAGTVSLLRAGTGLGKTELYVKYADGQTLIAVPTHDLRKEVVERIIIDRRGTEEMKALYKKIDKTEQEIDQLDIFFETELNKEDCPVLTVEEVPYIDKEFNETVERYYSTGDFKKANQFIGDRVLNILDRQSAGETIPLEELKLVRFASQRKALEKSRKLGVITHERLLRTPNTLYRTLIIDEDILPSLIKVGEVSIKDLKALMYFAKNDTEATKNAVKDLTSTLKRYVDIYTKIKKNETVDSPFFGITNPEKELLVRAIKEVKPTMNIWDLINSKHIGCFSEGDNKNVLYVVKRSITNLLPNKRCVIMSATLNFEIWDKYLTGIDAKKNFYDIGLIESKGDLFQYPKHSYSRNYIADGTPEEIAKKFKEVKDIVGDMPVISYAFLQGRKELNFVKDMYFGNTAGKDFLKGKDIAVVGTPNVSTNVIAMWAKALGYQYTSEDLVVSTNTLQGGYEYMNLEYNGCTFYAMTFHNVGLREIQFYLSNNELTQAVGRSRSLRYPANVFIFSNIPVLGANILK